MVLKIKYLPISLNMIKSNTRAIPGPFYPPDMFLPANLAADSGAGWPEKYIFSTNHLVISQSAYQENKHFIPPLFPLSLSPALSISPSFSLSHSFTHPLLFLECESTCEFILSFKVLAFLYYIKPLGYFLPRSQ